MASFKSENMACISKEDGVNNPEISQLDDTILMSFLEDSVQFECCDDDRLRSLIQSLEAAINPVLINDHGSLDYSYQLQDCVFDQFMSNYEEHMHDYQDNSASYDLDLSWMDIEMSSPSSSSSSSSSSPSDQDLSCWYEQVCEDDLRYNMIEYGGVGDYSETPLEEHTYSSLWQETYGL